MTERVKPTPNKLPVTVIGGYLGAGKSTLLNRLLHGDHQRRLAVLVNDFGAINIDADLIRQSDGRTIALSNGCVCCTIADDLGLALSAISELDPTPEHILIEASGVADPGKVAIFGAGWPGMRLASTVAIADVQTIRTRAADKFVGELVLRQMANADLVLLNKADLVGQATLNETQSWLQSVLPGVRTLVCTQCDLADLDITLGVGYQAHQADLLSVFKPQATDLFVTASASTEQILNAEAFRCQLARIPAGVLRAKGIIYLDEDPAHRFVLQTVGPRSELLKDAAWCNDTRRSIVSLIGLRGQCDVQAACDRLFGPADSR